MLYSHMVWFSQETTSHTIPTTVFGFTISIHNINKTPSIFRSNFFRAATYRQLIKYL